jgi:O-antigen/teichoic acid export membrane protein
MRLSTKAFILATSNFFAYGIQLTIGVFLARYFTREQYGTFLQVNLILTTCWTILIFGLDRSFYYFIPKFCLNEKRKFAIQSVLILFSIGIIGGVFLFIFIDWIALLMNNLALRNLSFFIAIAPLLFMLDQAFSDLLSSLELPVYNAYRKTILGILLFFSVLFCGVLYKRVDVVFWGILAVYVVQAIFLLGFIHRMPSDKTSDKSQKSYRWPRELKNQFKFSTPLGLSSISVPINSSLNKFVVANQFSVEQFAIFARGAIVPPIVSLVTFSVSDVIQPILVRLEHEGNFKEFLRLWHESIRKIALVIYPLFIFQFIFAREIIIFLYSEKYAESAVIYQIVLFSMLFRTTAWANILQVFRLNKKILSYQLVNLVTTVLLVLTLIKILGTHGAAAAPLIGFALYAFLSLRQISKRLEIPLIDSIPLRTMLTIFCTALASGILVSWIRWLSLPCIFKLTISFAIFLMFYGILISRTGALSRDDLYFFEKFKFFPWKLLSSSRST